MQRAWSIVLVTALAPLGATAGNEVGGVAWWTFEGPGVAATSPEFGAGCLPGAIAYPGTVRLLHGAADGAEEAPVEEEPVVLRFDLSGLVPCLVRPGVLAGDAEDGWTGSCVDPHVSCRVRLTPNRDGTFQLLASSSLGLQGWWLWADALHRAPLALPS